MYSVFLKKHLKQIRNVGFIMEAVVVIPLGAFTALFPWRPGRVAAAILGAFLYRLSRTARKRAEENLDIIYADKPLSRREKENIIKRLFNNIAISTFEYLKLGDITKKNHSRFVRFENPEAFELAVGEGKGVLAVSAHLGNWEILGSVGAKLGNNIGAIIHRQLNPHTDRWLKRIREKKGKVKCFYDEVSYMRRVMRHLKDRGVLAILADEIYPIRPLIVPFFGRPAATPDGPAKLHLLLGSPIVICFAIKETDGRYRLTFEGPFHFERSGNNRKDCEEIMSWIHTKYESVIVKHPDQWFSLLRPRWKQNRPENFSDRVWR